MRLKHILVWVIAFLICMAGSFTAIHVGKYLKENYYEEPQFRDLNGSPRIYFLIPFTIMFLSLAISSLLIARYTRWD